MSGDRLPVQKTFKLFIGGAFVRSESGRTFRQEGFGSASDPVTANLCHASRKDLREAVAKARKAQGGWASRSAFNRSQILYRISEVLESRRASLVDHLVTFAGYGTGDADDEVDAAIDRTFWYAGWCDKYAQSMGGVNPVASPYFNFSQPEATGVVAVLAPREAPLLGLLSAMLPALVTGNVVVAVVDGVSPATATELAEVIATSDVPGGVVNLLTGPREELAPVAAGHMDVNALAIFDSVPEESAPLQVAAADNVKRVALFDPLDRAGWLTAAGQSAYWIERFVEWKTAWHPIGV